MAQGKAHCSLYKEVRKRLISDIFYRSKDLNDFTA